MIRGQYNPALNPLFYPWVARDGVVYELPPALMTCPPVQAALAEGRSISWAYVGEADVWWVWWTGPGGIVILSREGSAHTQ